jgi:hypothetical protein
LASAWDGGRTWWAHCEFTRMNIELTIIRKKIEEQLVVGGSCVRSPRAGVWRLLEVSVMSAEHYGRRSLLA